MQGFTGTKSVSCLINSISRFIHLVSCQTTRSMPNLKDFESMARLLKGLKPFLDQVVDGNINPDEILLKECEKLDIDVNDAREFLEEWSPKSSRISSVWQGERVLTKIRTSSLEICRMLCRLLRSSPSSSTLAGVQNCIQELQSWEPNRVLAHIERALRDQSDKSTSCAEDIVGIVEFLGLTSNRELLKETIVVEKERLRAKDHRTKGEIDNILRISDLVSLIRDYMLKSGYFDSSLGFPVPSYFRCPLSLDLMLDPVIVASGQTFERASIQEWFDQGLTSCPKTGQPLSHTNTLQNYTIKAMISNWFEEKNHRLPSKSDSNSTSGSSMELGDEFVNGGHSYTHSRTHSESSAVTSFDGIKVECFSPNPKISDKEEISEKEFDGTTTSSCVEKLIEDLKSESAEIQGSAAKKIRLLAKNNVENREIIGMCGAIGPLIALLHSDSKTIQEHSVTALLNLSINEANKAMIAEAGAIEPFIYVLQSGNDSAKENSAAALFSLSVLEEHKEKIGRSGAVKGLVNLLAFGTVRGKKDAVTALFNLSICHENKARIVQAGAVNCLVKLLDQSSGLVDKSIALLANLATVSEGRSAIAREGGIPPIVEILDCGSRRGKENAASTLLQMCLSSNKFCNMVLQEGAVPPLVALSQVGTPRAKEKAQQLLAHFRSQRDAATRDKKKP